MKKYLLFVFAALLPLFGHAKVEIEGIWYNLDSSIGQAEVTYKGDNQQYSGNLTIPSTVTHNSVTYSVTSIGDQAFMNCHSLKSITIPASVTTIGDGAFQNCNLEAINIPEDSQLESIGNNAFMNCHSLKSITIPQKVTNIGGQAFANCGLKSITCNATTLPTIGDGAFSGLNNVTMYVPAGNVEDYQGITGWPASMIEARKYTLTISEASYATLYLDYAITIPENVEVYYASSVEGNQLRMTRVKGGLPAGIGVVVKGEGNYTFTEAEEKPNAITGSLLKGTTDKRSITAEKRCKYYVLAQKDGIVGMYRAKLTDGKFVNNANKAYLPLYVDGLDIYDEETDTEEDGGQLSNGLRFSFSDTSDIIKTTANEQQTTVVYDLQGRCVTDNEALKGIYIVGGKKQVLK